MARPLSFNPEKALTKAMFYFWKQGFRGASINELSEHLSVSKFSLYQQYGNKEEFYLKALEQYQMLVYRPLISALKPEQGIESVKQYLKCLEENLSQESATLGCLINNTIVNAKTMPDACSSKAFEATKELRYLLKRNFQVAQETGEIQCDAQTCLNFTLMTVQALIQTRKTLGMLVMRQNLRFFLEQMEKW